MTKDDVREFASSVKNICSSFPTSGSWAPDRPSDDRDAAVRENLSRAGWYRLRTGRADTSGTLDPVEQSIVVERG
ncbi:hypothetical protein [Rhodococcus wratislaviensis]|nr:hypothetical protein [Rhodococcus wratislaviensis]